MVATYNVSVLMVTISASVIFAKIEPGVLQLQAAGSLKLLLIPNTAANHAIIN